MVWKVVKSAQPPVRYRPNSDRRPDIVCSMMTTCTARWRATHAEWVYDLCKNVPDSEIEACPSHLQSLIRYFRGHRW